MRLNLTTVEIRIFVLDRIVTAKLTEEKFEVPSNFSMEKFTEGKFRVVGGKSETVRILFDSYIDIQKAHCKTPR